MKPSSERTLNTKLPVAGASKYPVIIAVKFVVLHEVAPAGMLEVQLKSTVDKTVDPHRSENFIPVGVVAYAGDVE